MKGTFIIMLLVILSCSNRFDLINKTFTDNPIDLNNEGSGSTKSYHFMKDNYSIDWIDKQHIPYAQYKIEEGKYRKEDGDLILTPTKKVFCQIFDLASHIPCDQIGSFIDPFYVESDTLSQSEISDLGFNSRVVSILDGRDGLVLIDQNLAFKLLAME